MLILIDKNTLRMIASASNRKLMALVQKWDFPEVNGLVVDSEIGREWTALDEDQMGILYTNMSGQVAPEYKVAIEQLRQYAGQWPEYPKPLSYFEDLEAQQTVSQPVTTEEAAAAQSTAPEQLAPQPPIEEDENGLEREYESEDIPGTGEDEGPFYWVHPESNSCGFVETRAELNEALSHPCVEEIDKDRYEELTANEKPEDAELSAGTHFVSHRDLEQAQNHEPVSRATHQAIITGVENANKAMTPEQKEAAKASAPTKPEKAKSAEPSAPRKPGATKMVWDIADARLAANPGMDLKTLRKLIVAECKAQGINEGTAGTQFGKWKSSKGL